VKVKDQFGSFLAACWRREGTRATIRDEGFIGRVRAGLGGLNLKGGSLT
jgi:hypothetical protein